MTPTPLAGDLTVVDLSSGIAGAYCGKLLVDGGADVIKVEPPEGDPLRLRRILDDTPSDRDAGSVLFQFLASSKSSVVADRKSRADPDLVVKLVRGARRGYLVERARDGESGGVPAEALRPLAPEGGGGGHHTVRSGQRARRARQRVHLAGDVRRWPLSGTSRQRTSSRWWIGRRLITGLFAALGLLTAHIRARVTGVGELVDVAMLDALHLTQGEFLPTKLAAAGEPPRSRRGRTVPSIHPTLDGYVGFQVTTGQQWQDFAVMVGHPEWAEDPTLTRFTARMGRYAEICSAVDEWTSVRATSEIVELAVLFRLPVAPVANGKTIQEFEQTAARGWYLDHPGGFTHPEVPYILHGKVTRRAFGAAPRLGRDTEVMRTRPITPKQSTPTGIDRPLPFEGLRIADFTAFWAGPIIAHYFAMLGADVVHVESTVRPDGYRASTLKYDMSEGWWEASPNFAAANTNKATSRLTCPRGRVASSPELSSPERCRDRQLQHPCHAPVGPGLRITQSTQT